MSAIKGQTCSHGICFRERNENCNESNDSQKADTQTIAGRSNINLTENIGKVPVQDAEKGKPEINPGMGCVIDVTDF